MRKLTSTEPTSSGWQSGMRSAVRLAAWMPATRATASTSPLVIAPRATSEVVSGFMKHPAPGDGPAVRGLLGRDVDHAGPAQRVEVGEADVGHGPESSEQGPFGRR